MSDGKKTQKVERIFHMSYKWAQSFFLIHIIVCFFSFHLISFQHTFRV